MKKLSPKDKLMLLVVAAVAVLGGGFWFYVKPAKKELSAQTTRAQDAEASVQNLQNELNQLMAKTKPGAQAIKTNVADQLRLDKAYPTKPDLPATILQIESIARKSGVSFDEGTPDKGTDFAGTTGTAFTIKVTGRYFNVQDFIYRLHNQVRVSPNGRLEINGRLFAVTKADIGLSESGEGGTSGSSSRVTRSTPVEATITAVAFSRTPAAAGAGAATTQPTSTGGAGQ